MGAPEATIGTVSAWRMPRLRRRASCSLSRAPSASMASVTARARAGPCAAPRRARPPRRPNRPALVVLPGEPDLRRVGVRDRRERKALAVGHVDRTPVGELGHEQPRQAVERLRLVSDEDEQLPGLRQRRCARSARLTVGDVVDDVDGQRAAVPGGRAPRSP